MTQSKVIDIAPLFIDISEDIDTGLLKAQNLFQTQIERVPNFGRFFELEINRLFESRFGTDPFRKASYDSISLQGYYNIGWDLAERGNAEEMPATLYWWDKEVLSKVVDKYGDKELPSDYNSRLDVVAKEEYKEGAVNALFYYWLKDQFKEMEDNPSHDFEKRSVTLPIPQLQWNASTNTLITLCYDFVHNGVITWNGKTLDGAKMEIVRMLCRYFVDKNGKQLSAETIKQGLKPEGPRAKHRIDISNLTLSLQKNVRKDKI